MFNLPSHFRELARTKFVRKNTNKEKEAKQKQKGLPLEREDLIKKQYENNKFFPLETAVKRRSFRHFM